MRRVANRSPSDPQPLPPEPPREDLELRFADVTLNATRREVARGGGPLRLTALEYDLLAFLLRHPYEAHSRRRLSEAVWGSAYDNSSNYVDVAVMSLRRRLEVDGKPRVIQTLRGYGYALREVT